MGGFMEGGMVHICADLEPVRNGALHIWPIKICLGEQFVPGLDIPGLPPLPTGVSVDNLIYMCVSSISMVMIDPRAAEGARRPGATMQFRMTSAPNISDTW